MYGKDSQGIARPLLVDSNGKMVAASVGGKYAAAVLAGNVYIAANQTAVALTQDDALAFTGLVLANPAASGKNLIILEFGYATTVATPTATLLGLMVGLDAGDAAAAITPVNRLIGCSNTSVALPDNDCTLVGTPVLHQLITSAWSEATTAGSVMGPHVVDINGSLVLGPGSYVATWSFATNTAAWQFHFMWEEVPV